MPVFLPTCAGHEWGDDRIDSQCISPKGEESCRMTRSAMFLATEQDIDQEGFAHVSRLSSGEYRSIASEREKYQAHCDKLMEALRLVCG